ncbi:hypothetical protein [Formosa sp. L2A11]|uniref:hypothetical protein n=1 Tax=Formosa sp. L2A11 TaxID=2686363 RepID=UPI00131CD8E8|nr:hypothetical protein [Formosa sp. L2A11]
MNINRFKNKWACFGVFTTTVIGLYYYYDQSMIGFPDGHLTEYDAFYKSMLFPVFFSLNTLFLIGFIVSLLKTEKSKKTFIMYIAVFVLFLMVNYYCSIHLEHGQGG